MTPEQSKVERDAGHYWDLKPTEYENVFENQRSDQELISRTCKNKFLQLDKEKQVIQEPRLAWNLERSFLRLPAARISESYPPFLSQG